MSVLHMLRSLSVIVLSVASAYALQMDDLTLTSPITKQPFTVVGIPIDQIMGDALADMGYDDDGCRHTSEVSEYSYYVATDPYSYFSALSAEWDRKGNFNGSMPPDMRQWVEQEFNSDWSVDYNRAFKLANASALASGLPAPDRKTFVMPQQAIPIEKRYHYALMCYAHRGARPAVLAKTALMGAWALRTFLNVPIGNQALDGGYEEVNDKVRRNIKDGEAFQVQKWITIYRKIFEDGNLTHEGTMIAGLAYFGLALRDGDLPTASSIIERLDKKFKELDDSNKSRSLLLGIVRERKHMLDEYLNFMSISTDNFIQAIQDEEFTRDDLINTKLLIVAEGLRRTGHEQLAIDWYLALSQMIETQPKLREEMRQQNKAPSADASQPVQVGWMADQQIAQLTKAGIIHGSEYAGPNRALLHEIVTNGFGKPDYVNPNWRPVTDRTPQEAMSILNTVGKSILEFNFRLGSWPTTLNEMWERNIVRDRNYLNRFHDPVKGQPLLYQPPSGSASELPSKTILVCTSQPITCAQGDVYLAFLANSRIEFCQHPVQPGDVFVK